MLDAIRGKNVNDALGLLAYNPRKGSALIEKLLKSAIANAQNNNGMNPDDLRIPFAFEEAEKEGLRFCFDTVELRDVHPNTAVLELTGEKGGHLTIQACSIGGGAIEVTALDGYEVSFTGNYNTLVIRNQDEFGTLAGVTTILSQFHINVGNMSLHRNKRGGDALMIIETDQHIKPSQVAFLGELPGIRAITYYDKEDEEYGFTLHR